MRKRILAVLLALTLLLSATAVAAGALTYVDTAMPGSLQLSYSHDGKGVEGLQIRIYRVAELSQFAEFTLTGAFSELPVDINNVRTQDEWKQVAATLAVYAAAGSFQPDREATTDADGLVSFTQLPLGLYLIEGVQFEKDNGYCLWESSVISVPGLDGEENWIYDVVAKPKSSFQEIGYQEISYTVNKLWKDAGHEIHRPQNITVELYRNRVLVETVTLSAENNWSYSWTTLDDGAVWQVVEAGVAEGYKVTVSRKGTTFSVTNSYGEPTTPPYTGDIADIGLYLVIMCVAGAGLLVLGIAGRKGKMR